MAGPAVEVGDGARTTMPPCADVLGGGILSETVCNPDEEGGAVTEYSKPAMEVIEIPDTCVVCAMTDC